MHPDKYQKYSRNMMMKEGHDLGLKQALDIIQTATAYFTT